MADLAATVEQLYRINNVNASDLPAGHDKPIRIVQIGKNDYVCLIAGTDADKDGSLGLNGWYNAVVGGLNIQTEYVKKVKNTLLHSGIPKGANVHLVGHSQGGYVANYLAIVEPDVYEHYNLSSVTAFATPGIVPVNREIGKENYHTYITHNDPLRAHEGLYNLSITGHLPNMVDPDIIPGNLGAYGSKPFDNLLKHGHTTYHTSLELSNESLPFEIDPNYVGDFDEKYAAEGDTLF